MLLQSCLLCDAVQLAAQNSVLILNSASDTFVQQITQNENIKMLILAEDNIAAARAIELPSFNRKTVLQHTAFHDYILHHQPGTIDVAVMNLLYLPGTAWVAHGLQLAAYALRPGGLLYVTGAKDRGILSTAKRIQALFGNVETLKINKGQRVVCARKLADRSVVEQVQDVTVFASNKLDEGTRQLLSVLEIRATDKALDIGCGAGFLGLHIARQATRGRVTMVDVSLAAVAIAQRAVEQSNLTNINVLASDGAEAVLDQRFDLVVTNPPFHQGGIQTTEIAKRFIRQAAQVLQTQGRFYLVANRFLKYEPELQMHFKNIKEVGGDTRYKVIRAQFQ